MTGVASAEVETPTHDLGADLSSDEVLSGEPQTDHGPGAPPEVPDEPAFPVSDRFERIVTTLVVATCSLFVFWQLQPDLILSNTTPTGGDMGAHVWGPAFLREVLLPRFRLPGWEPAW